MIGKTKQLKYINNFNLYWKILLFKFGLYYGEPQRSENEIVGGAFLFIYFKNLLMCYRKHFIKYVFNHISVYKDSGFNIQIITGKQPFYHEFPQKVLILLKDIPFLKYMITKW